MENPYAPLSNEEAETSAPTWVATGFAVLTGVLSILVLVVIVSNYVVLFRLPTWPMKVLQWIGIIAMTTVMCFTSIAFAHISIGLFRSQRKTWKRGIWILLASVLGYATLVALAMTTSVFA